SQPKRQQTQFDLAESNLSFQLPFELRLDESAILIYVHKQPHSGQCKQDDGGRNPEKKTDLSHQTSKTHILAQRHKSPQQFRHRKETSYRSSDLSASIHPSAPMMSPSGNCRDARRPREL